MVLLWRDPEGNSVKSATVHNSVPTQNHCSKEMQKISALEKNISEKDNMIAKLQDELKMLKEVSSKTLLLVYIYSIINYLLSLLALIIIE